MIDVYQCQACLPIYLWTLVSDKFLLLRLILCEDKHVLVASKSFIRSLIDWMILDYVSINSVNVSV